MFRISERFLATQRNAMNLDGRSRFSAAEVTEVGGHRCVRRPQILDEIEILGASSRLCFSPLGQAEESASNICDRDCSHDLQSIEIDEANAPRKAAERMKEMLGDDFGKAYSIPTKPKKLWMEDPANAGLIGAYAVDLTTSAPYGRFVAYIHGTTGDLLGYERRIFHVDGEGEVRRRDPVNTPKLEKLPLLNLLNLNQLKTELWEVQNEDGPAASDDLGIYSYDESDTHFDEVQVFYGMQVAMQKYRSWGYKPFGFIPIVVHLGTDYANAYYDGDQIALGDGDGVDWLDFAKDNSVIAHEYGHAIVDHLAHLVVMSVLGDGAALHEGYGDYFACAVYDSPDLGAGVKPKGNPMRECDTNLDISTRLDFDPHVGGQVWSAALWEARTKLGAQVVDPIALQALTRLEPSGNYGTATMEDMAQAVLAADQVLNGGRNSTALITIFKDRGFEI